MSHWFIYLFRFHPPPSFTGFQWIYLPKAQILRTNGRVPLSGVIIMRTPPHCFGLSHTEQPSSMCMLSLRICWQKMKNRERKLGQNSVWEAKWHSCQFYLISNRAARVIISLGCGQLRLKVRYLFIYLFLNFMLFPSTTPHKLWI